MSEPKGYAEIVQNLLDCQSVYDHPDRVHISEEEDQENKQELIYAEELYEDMIREIVKGH